MKSSIAWLGLVVLVGCGGGSVPVGGLSEREDGTIGDEGIEVLQEEGGGSDPGPGEASVAQPDVAEDPGREVEGEVVPGAMGWPCEDGKECYSGYCIETPDGYRCTALCLEAGDCPDGYQCLPVATKPDIVFACIHPAPRQCRPCQRDQDCEVAFATTPMVCAGLGGRFACLKRCSAGCSATETCQEVSAVEGRSAQACVLEGGCECTAKYVEAASEGLCEVGNEYGICRGVYHCTAEGPGPCDARVPGPEVCNGLDDDCDGETDEGTGGQGCEVRNEYGTCPGGQSVCEGGQEVCVGKTPALEVCNAQDDDCDGETDEGTGGQACEVRNEYGTCPGGETVCEAGQEVCVGKTPALEVCNGQDDDCDGMTDNVVPGEGDLDGDGIGDTCDPDDDGDGVPDEVDNCPVIPNGDQADLDLDGVGDPCDCDQDGDGVGNSGVGKDGVACPPCAPCDNCPAASNPDQADLDGDGVGDACDSDRDGDGDPNQTDCAPDDLLISHHQTEACNGVDDDCDGLVDEEDATGCATWFWDQDGDGWGLALAKCLCAPTGPYQGMAPGDCNDLDAEVHPDAQEVCGNGKDDNCNGSENDEGAIACVWFYEDLDGDGYGTGGGTCLCSAVGDLTAKNGGDCDDGDVQRNPGLDEKCQDEKDNDCDGQTDEEGCAGCKTYFRDEDQDGYGVTGDKQCLGAAQYPYTAYVGGDCDDQNASVRPGALEVCNGLDDNCDGTTDPAGTQGCQNLYPDADGDGYGALNQPAMCYCQPSGIYRATVSGDCVDSDKEIHPGATEGCDGMDNNCNGQVDEGLLQTFFKDADGDGYGIAGDSRSLCAPQGLYTATQSGDCDDQDAQKFPGNVEVCDGKDNNCNGQVDEGLLQTFFKDSDGDGYGIAGDSRSLCAPQGLYTATQSGDCDDQDAQKFPGNVEVCDGKDNNCNGQVDEGLLQTFFKDADGDGYGIAGDSRSLCAPQGLYTATQSGDCDDQDAQKFPGNIEVCDGKDNNCNGQPDEGVLLTFYRDYDGDGWGGVMTQQACQAPAGYVAQTGDCNDFNALIHPDAPEACNEVDDDCNGFVDDGLPTVTIYKDNDYDGFAPEGAVSQDKCDVPLGWTAVSNPRDCNDTDATVYPGALDVCRDGKDNDCNGYPDVTCPTVCPGNWPVYLGPGNVQCTVSAADLDNDGRMEVIVGCKGVVLDASGAVVKNLPSCDTWPRGVNIAQLDARPDFRWDIVCKNRVFDWDGQRADLPGSPYNTPTIGDVNGDGVPDIVVGTWGAQYLVHLGAWDSNGKWYRASTHSLALSTTGQDRSLYAPTLVDLDGDGVQDIITGSGYRSDAEGEFPDGRIYAWRWNGSQFVRHCPLNPGNPDTCFETGHLYWWTGASVAVDYDQDGLMEIVFPENGTYVFDTQGNVKGSGFNGLPLDLDRNGSYEWATAYAYIYSDFDRDGILERYHTNHLQELTGAYVPGWPVNNYGPERWQGTVADLDGDGSLEVVFADNQYVQCFSLGANSWERNNIEWYGWYSYYTNPFNRDGQMDSFEPTNDSVARAPILAGQRGQVRGYIWRSGDVDYYRVPVFQYWTAYVLRLKVPAGLDYDLVVTSADGTVPACSSTKGPGMEEACTASAAVPGVDWKGYFLVKVFGKGATDRSSVRGYLLTWEKNNY